jgi:hypothetical protein
MQEHQRSQFEHAVEAVRAGFIFAHSEAKSQYLRWRNRAQRAASGGSIGLTGASLERAVMAIAARDPSLVMVKAA